MSYLCMVRRKDGSQCPHNATNALRYGRGVAAVCGVHARTFGPSVQTARPLILRALWPEALDFAVTVYDSAAESEADHAASSARNAAHFGAMAERCKHLAAAKREEEKEEGGERPWDHRHCG